MSYVHLGSSRKESIMTPYKIAEDAWDNFHTMFPDNQGIYISSLPPSKILHSFFKDKQRFIDEFVKLKQDIPLYTCFNQLSDEFINNVGSDKFTTVQSGCGPKNTDVTHYRAIVIDIDPLNTLNIELDNKDHFLATGEMNQKTLVKAESILNWIQEKASYSGGFIINSGNGAYVVVPIDPLKSTDDNSNSIKNLVKYLAEHFNDSDCMVDIGVTSIGHRFKLPGTMSCKGIETDYTKHRRSGIHSLPPESTPPMSNDKVHQLFKSSSKKKLVSKNGSRGKDKFSTGIAVEVIENHSEVFTDQIKEPYANIVYGNYEKDLFPINSDGFYRAVKRILREECNERIIPKSDMETIIDYFRCIAYEEDEVFLHNRIAYLNEDKTIYYDLCSKDHKVIKINNFNVTIEDKPDKLFRVNTGDASQVMPDLSANPKDLLTLLPKYFHINTGDNTERYYLIILATYIVSCFIGLHIPHPILTFAGSKGAAKSTASRFCQQIVSPQITGLTTLPKRTDDVAIRLANTILAVFDNLSAIKEDISNLLCVAVTGGVTSKRKLYTDSTEVYLMLKSMIIVNGIDVIATKSDLLDRSLIIDLQRLKPNEFRPEEELNREFQKDLPLILGACFKIIAEVIEDESTITVNHPMRLIDFYILSIRIANVLGISQQEMEEAFAYNQTVINARAIESQPVAVALINYMKDKPIYISSVADLLKKLIDACEDYSIDTRQALFPKTPAALSHRLKEVESNLKEAGLSFDITNKGAFKEITIQNSAFGAIDYDTLTKDDLVKCRLPIYQLDCER
jgi:hypothetical protein